MGVEPEQHRPNSRKIYGTGSQPAMVVCCSMHWHRGALPAEQVTEPCMVG